MEVWHVRHGERCDEVSGAERLAWKRSAAYQEGRNYDPPLTKYGHVQATRAGMYLNSLPFNQGPDQNQFGFDRVYTSPLLRAVQTAVCISRALGNLPLQVVPGLCSCTAGLVRVGYEQAILMADADIREDFPDVNLLPRDPLAPTSFQGAQAWLASRSHRRVLAVGHREGTKAMARIMVPTPHCCIGIFRIHRAENSYELHDLLSYKGKSLGSRGSSYARSPQVTTTRESSSRDDVNDVSRLLISLDVTSSPAPSDNRSANRNGGSNGTPSHLRRSDSDAVELNFERHGVGKGPQGHTSTVGATRDSLSSGVRWLTRRLSIGARSMSARGSKVASGARVNGRKAKGSKVSQRAEQEAGGGEGKINGAPTALAGMLHGGAVSTLAGGVRAAPPPRCIKKECGPGFAATGKSGGPVVGGADGKPIARGACAGRGFRVATFARRSMGESSLSAGLAGIPLDVLCGLLGVLSFLRPADLCMTQLVSKTMAIAATRECLWMEFYSQLPKRLRDQTEASLAPVQAETTMTEGAPHPKTLFARAARATLASRASRTAQMIAVVRRRLGVIHSRRASVDALKANVAVRLNGAAVHVVDSRGTKTKAWVSRASILSEPSACNGLRIFALSSSVKVKVPPMLVTSAQLLRSMNAALSLPDPWLPRVVVFHVNCPLLSTARLLRRSTDNAVALYEVFRSTDLGVRNGNGTILPPTPRACALLGVVGGHEDGQEYSGGVGFLTVHFPHELVLDVATRRLPWEDPPGTRQSRSFGDDSIGPAHGLENFAVAVGLRTAGVPVWETASVGVDGRLCQRFARPRGQHSDGVENRGIVCIDLVRPDATTAATAPTENMLRTCPGLPYSTPGGLSGVVEDVLLADLTLCDPDGDSLWAFTSPIVFEALPETETGRTGGIGIDDGIFDMTHTELREERRRGIVEEARVGRVIVELALVECSEDEDPAQSAAQRRCPAGHAWMVRVASVELEVGFVDAWFGTKHGRT